MGIIINTLIHIACLVGVLILFVPYMLMFSSQMKIKYKEPSLSNSSKFKMNSFGIGSIITFVTFILIFTAVLVWSDNGIFFKHRCFLNCDYCADCYAEYYAEYYAGFSSYAYSPDCYSPNMCYEFGCNYCVDYFRYDEFTRYSYAFTQWLYAIPRVLCVLLMPLSMIETKYKYGIKSTKFIPAIILFAVSLILTSIFIEVWIAMLIFAVCSIICFALAVVLYVLAIKKQCKLISIESN